MSKTLVLVGGFAVLLTVLWSGSIQAQEESSERTKWEFRCVTIDVASQRETESTLNRHGESGWEPVLMFDNRTSAESYQRGWRGIVLRRPK